MKNIKLVSIVSILFLLTGCFKTTEDIRREQLVDNLEVQMTDSRKMSLTTMDRIQNLEEKISSLTGNIEESTHQTKSEQAKKVDELKAEIALIKTNQETIQEDIKNIDKRLVAQKQYLDSLLKTLSDVTGKKEKPKKRSKYNQAMHDYKTKNYTAAKAALLELENSSSVKGKRKARVIHNLGMIAYSQKNYQDATVYFSRLFTEHPQVSYNQNGMLHLARSFKKMGQNDQAIQAYTVLIEKFPKFKYKKQAEKELKRLQK